MSGGYLSFDVRLSCVIPSLQETARQLVMKCNITWKLEVDPATKQPKDPEVWYAVWAPMGARDAKNEPALRMSTKYFAMRKILSGQFATIGLWSN